MPTCTEPTLSPADRRRQVASILARGVIRWRRRAKAVGTIDAPESARARESRLALPGETRLNVSDGTRGIILDGDVDQSDLGEFLPALADPIGYQQQYRDRFVRAAGATQRR